MEIKDNTVSNEDELNSVKILSENNLVKKQYMQVIETSDETKPTKQLVTIEFKPCNDYLPSKSQTFLHDFQSNKSFDIETPNQNIKKDRYVIESRCSPNEDFSSGLSANYVPTSETAEQPDRSIKSKNQVQKRVETKRLRNSGKEYTSSRGKIVKARSMKPPCPNKCILSCSKRNSEDFRRQIFEDYWKMSNLQRQRDFLYSCIEQLNLKFRRISSAVPRKPNCAFYLLNNGQKIRVCRLFLINTMGIADRTLRTVIQSKISGNDIAPKDKRGKHNKHKRK